MSDCRNNDTQKKKKEITVVQQNGKPTERFLRCEELCTVFMFYVLCIEILWLNREKKRSCRILIKQICNVDEQLLLFFREVVNIQAIVK